MNYLRSFRPALIFLTFLALAALAVSAMYDGLPPVSANSYAGPCRFTPRTQLGCCPVSAG